MNELELQQASRIQALEKVILLLVSKLSHNGANNHSPTISHHDAEHLASILLAARP